MFYKDVAKTYDVSFNLLQVILYYTLYILYTMYML